MYKEELIPIVLKIPKSWKEWNTPKFILQSYNYPDTKTKSRHYKKKEREREREKITGKHLLHINAIILSKVFANHTQQYTKRIIYHDQLEFIPRKDICFSIHKSINVKNLYQQRKSKNHMTVWIAAQEAFDKIQYPFMIKSLSPMWV